MIIYMKKPPRGSSQCWNNLISLDIGYITTGVTVTYQNKTKVFGMVPTKEKVTTLAFPKVISLSEEVARNISNKIFQEMDMDSMHDIALSMEYPVLQGEFSTGLGILITTLANHFMKLGVSHIYYTPNTLGKYYQKVRKSSKSEIVEFVSKLIPKDIYQGRLSSHMADSFLQHYLVQSNLNNNDLFNLGLRKDSIQVEMID